MREPLAAPGAEAARPELPIVAIGASAGGLEPLKAFFRAMPANAQLAFVVITHLPADHVSHLPELLDRLLEASGGRLGILTLAPELPGALELIRRATAAGTGREK